MPISQPPQWWQYEQLNKMHVFVWIILMKRCHFFTLLNDKKNPVYLCLQTVSQWQIFSVLRVSELLRSLQQDAVFLWTSQSTSHKTTFGYFSCDRRQTKAHFGPSKCFLSYRSTDAHPNMARGSATTLHSPSTSVGNIALARWAHDTGKVEAM